jgi:hypothetical protein
MRIEDQTKYNNLIRDIEHIRRYLQALNKAYIVYIKPLEDIKEILRECENREHMGKERKRECCKMQQSKGD